MVIEVGIKPDEWKESNSGKSQVAGTGGFIPVDGGYKLSVNLIRPIDGAKEKTK